MRFVLLNEDGGNCGYEYDVVFGVSENSLKGKIYFGQSRLQI